MQKYACIIIRSSVHMCNVFWTALQMNDTNLLLCHSGAVVVIEGNLLNSGKLGKSCITYTCTPHPSDIALYYLIPGHVCLRQLWPQGQSSICKVFRLHVFHNYICLPLS